MASPSRPSCSGMIAASTQRLGAIARNGAEAKDVLQKAYVRAYAALSDFRGAAASLATWLTPHRDQRGAWPLAVPA